MTWLFIKVDFKLINMVVLIFGTCSWHVWAWCRQLHGKRGCHEILKKAWVEFSLGTMGIESWCFLLVLCFWSFMNFRAWFAALFMSSVWPYHFVYGVMLLFLFMVFFLFVSCLAFYVLSLGNWLGKRKVDGNWERCVVPNRWNKTQMKLCAWVSVVEGKTMKIGWTGWVHCGKWTIVVQTQER